MIKFSLFSGHLPILGNFPDTFELIDDAEQHARSSRAGEDSKGNVAGTQIMQVKNIFMENICLCKDMLKLF